MITDSFVISLTTLALCQGIFPANYLSIIYNDGNEEIQRQSTALDLCQRAVSIKYFSCNP